jgi:hypothetical protein
VPGRNLILTADTYLDSVAKYLPRELVSRAAFVAIRGIARRLPPLPTIGFEAHLGPRASGVDFAVCIRPSERYHLSGEGLWTDLELADKSPVWNRLRELTSRWGDPACCLNRGIYNLWLEFDVQFAITSVPNVLIGLRGGLDTVTVAQETTELLLGERIKGSTWRSVERCFGALPAGGHVFQIGVWLSRSLEGLRVCVHGVSVNQIPSYLAAIGWRGDSGRLQKMFPYLNRLTHSVAIDLDLVGEVLPRLGIECLPVEKRLPEFDSRWKALLDNLVADGLCTNAQEEGLLAWPGCNQRRLIWSSLFVRGLNHVKLVLEPDGKLKAKAYFGFVQMRGDYLADTSLTETVFGCEDLHDA